MNDKRTLLIVDDDLALRQALGEQFTLQPEFDVIEAGSAEAGKTRALEDAPDAVLMDVGLPDQDGREAVRELRAKGFRRPILMLTAHDADDDVINGLEAGANDYIAKPFRFAVLLARVRSALRQHDSTDDAEFRIGPYMFRPAARSLVDVDGGKLRLTEKEAAILRFLHKANRQAVSRDVLLKDVWGYNSNVTTHTLETHIYRLRQKIEVDPTAAKLLVTDEGGYRLET